MVASRRQGRKDSADPSTPEKRGWPQATDKAARNLRIPNPGLAKDARGLNVTGVAGIQLILRITCQERRRSGGDDAGVDRGDFGHDVHSTQGTNVTGARAGFGEAHRMDRRGGAIGPGRRVR